MIMTLDLASEVEEIKFYFLGDGNLDGVVELEDYYLGWGLVETKNNKFLVKCQKSDDNNFYLAFEYFEWERYRTKFRVKHFESPYLSGPISVTGLTKQADYITLNYGVYLYGNGIDTVYIGILGKKLPNMEERRKIAKDWDAIIPILINE